MQRARVHALFFIIFFFICTSQPATAENFFHFNRPKLALDLSYEVTRETRKGQDINSEDITNDFTEQFRLETEGFIYHPALFDFKLGLSPEWTQTSEEHSAGTASKSNEIDATMLGYFFNASVFQFKPYTLNFFANKQDSDITSSFAQRTNTRTNTYGTNLSLKYRTLPSTLAYVHTESQQKGFYSSSNAGDELRLTMKLPKENKKTELNVSFVDTTRDTNSLITTIETLNSELQNRWDFSEDKRRDLFSSLIYRQTQGSSLNNSAITFNQNLSWEHTKALDSNYQAYYSKNKSGDFDSETKTLNAGLSYDISNNLRTNISSEASGREYQGGEEQIYKGSVGFDYNKDTPAGAFALNSNHSYSLRYRDATEGYVQSLNEPHALNDTDLVYLGQKNIDTTSVVVTNSAGTVIYTENIDYTLTEQAPYLRIIRIPLGAITNGETVLVSFQYDNPAAFDDAIFSQSYGVTYSPFEPLSFLYRYTQSRQIYNGGVAPGTLDNSIVHSGEAIWDVKWSRARVSYQDSFQNSGSSYTRWVAEETLSYRPSRSLFSMLSASYGETRFEETNGNETFYLIKSKIDYSPTRSWKISIEGFRNNISGDSVSTLDHGVSIDFNMYYGIWSSSIEYEYINEKNRLFDESREINSIMFKISRRLW
ncbi:MAG: hypothetical protein PF503_10380 [Desulfobacula sp.]|jgi:hypothetical protein|nr:hypothetical protein [Desulfobacula sp.]